MIRCKLNAPMLTSDPQGITHWEYDGFLRTRNNKVFWMFEKREAMGSDFFFFITDQGRGYGEGDQERLTLSGTYLTTGQDPGRSIVTSDVVLRRLSRADIENELAQLGERHALEIPHDDAQKIRGWMGRTAKPVKAGEPEYSHINRLWKRLKNMNQGT